ncbi:MAG: AAA family ATPase [Desulfocapsa sp.]|nr:AAA family ATPase [Desulfocapsa sp.]
MPINFRKIPIGTREPSKGISLACLTLNNWDDFSYKSLFYLTVFDEKGEKVDIGNVKIGYIGQTTGWTEKEIALQFENLGSRFFSLGQDSEYYENIINNLTPPLGKQVLESLNDIVHNSKLLDIAEKEDVYSTSLLRGVSVNSIKNQFKRILLGDAPLTKFHFSYSKSPSSHYSGIDLHFNVEPNSKPATNVHILIGRNGVGKTTLLNNIVSSVVDLEKSQDETGTVSDTSSYKERVIKNDYFSSVISVAFSAFDPFNPPEDQIDRSKGTCFYYVGLKNVVENDGEKTTTLKNRLHLKQDFINSLKSCFSIKRKKERWINAIETLESDENFAQMHLCELTNIEDQGDLSKIARKLYSRMSSGHAIVLLSVTKLIELVEEKTLVLMDEPESHLHPPLLSAFIRALSDLLYTRNGVAIIATHSPVVLQEVPMSCVWKLFRNQLVGKTERLERETFGENVGTLTREVFGLEVIKSGFHRLLQESVAKGHDYDEILEEYNNQLGFEGKAILRALIANRDQ